MRVQVKEERSGINGGLYWWVPERHRVVHISQVATHTEETADGIAYDLDISSDQPLFAFDFSKTGRLHGEIHQAGMLEDAGVRGPTDPLAWLDVDGAGAKKLLDSVELLEEASERLDSLREQARTVQRFLKKHDIKRSTSGQTQRRTWLTDPDLAALKSAVQGTAGSIRQSLSQTLKIMFQLRIVKEVTEAWSPPPSFDEVNGKLGRKGKTDHRLPELEVTTGRPTISLQARNGDLSIWHEFQAVSELRPDIFVVLGQHNSPYRDSVEPFLEEVAKDDSFVTKAKGEWITGLATFLTGQDASTIPTLDEAELDRFLRELLQHLKPGVVIESKGEVQDGTLDLTEKERKQLGRYREYLADHELVLVSWVPCEETVPGFRVIDDFGNASMEKREELPEVIRSVEG